MSEQVTAFGKTYTVSGGAHGVVIYQAIGDGGYIYLGERYYQRGDKEVNDLCAGIPKKVMNVANRLFDIVPKTGHGEPRATKTSPPLTHHCFYCGSRIENNHCPGCGSLNWDRQKFIE